MKEKDMKIINHLRRDARMPLTKMSRKTQIPVSTIFDKLKIFEEDLIIKHTTLIDFSKLGYYTRANIAFRVDREDKELLKKHLLKHTSINSVYRINNGYDFMIEAIFKQIKDIEDFTDEIEQKFKILDKKTYYIIEDLKKESFLTNADYF
ncbi:Lrp/AsnC family transcriptional regulator [Candidatus Woesearchaeota archaeon]|nr:Lrp/AsnC family transcriptional regulator [Candidatus Woesearchaeota archaeon]